jgi:hypothetical protein
MGLLNLFKSPTRTPSPLPSGSFTVDRTGEIVTSTVLSSFSRDALKQIAAVVLRAFRDAKKAEVVLGEMAIDFDAMVVKARELRGGAIIFLSPRGISRK